MAAFAFTEADQPRRQPAARVELTLPFPPSVNRIWKFVGGARNYPGSSSRRSVIRDPAYSAWLNTCDGTVLEQLGVTAYRKTVKGRYILTVTLCSSRFGYFDQDNCVKAISDFLQRARIIENDKWAWRTVIEWGDIENSQQKAPLCHVNVEGIL